jgi:PAS domain S-box-containing protein
VIYALVGGLWILWSDRLLIKFIQDVQTLNTFQTYKGWLYVLFTTLLLYGLTNNLVIRIQAGEERISSLSNSLPIGLFYTTPEGNIKDVNLTMVEILAYPDKETLINKGPGDLYVDLTDRDQLVATLENEGSIRNFVTRFYRYDGEIIWLEGHMTLIEDGYGNPIYEGGFIDTTERKKADADLRESEERYRTLFENTTDVLFIMKGTRIIDCNQVVSTMFGFTKDEMLGKHPQEISPHWQPDGHSSFEKAERIFQEVIEGSPQLFEWIHQRKDGSLFTAEVFLHKVIVQGDDYNMAVIRDITKRKKDEEVALEERQRLARDLHDAVSQTLWSASLIADVVPDIWEQDPAQGLERLGRLRQLTRGALAEMRTLLLELRPKALIETEISELLNRLIEVAISRSEAQISLDFNGECALPEDVHVTLYRIAQEAINNAAQHSKASDIKVRLACEPKNVKLEIEDNGCGFNPEETLPGQHLGLAIMRERATSIEARLDIISRSGEGTQVGLVWPDDREVNDD